MLASSRARQTPVSNRAEIASPTPLLCSRSRDWPGIVVELYHFEKVDHVVPMHEHVVGVHLAGAVNLLQARGRRSTVTRVRAGDVTITPSGEPKRFQHAGENVVVILRLAPALVLQVAGDEYALDPGRFEVKENLGSPDPEIVAIAKELLAALELEGPPARLCVESQATELAIHLLRHHCTATVTLRRPESNLPPRKLQRVLDYIDANLRDDMALADLARVIAMSPGHFAHLFRQTVGVPPHRFVVEKRIERAKLLLRDTDLPITEIAQRVGCASHSHLTVMFHRDAGVTPSDFRRGHDPRRHAGARV